MKLIPIRSIDCAELAPYVRLTENELRSRLEPEQGIFIAQTPKVISAALDGGCRPVSILAEDRQISETLYPLLERAGDIPVYTAPAALLRQLTGYSLTRGILSAMRRPALPSPRELCRGAGRLAVLDGIADSTNMGALFRSAAALGMDGVLVTSTCCDPLIRRSVRVSMGALFRIPWTRTGSDAPGWIAFLRSQGFRIVSMVPGADGTAIDECGLRTQPRLAILLGSEGWGLPPEITDASDYRVRIPMADGIDSLNVAAAGAVAFWELRKISR